MIYIIKSVIAIAVYVLVVFLLVKKVKNKNKKLCRILLLAATLAIGFFVYSTLTSAIPYFSYLAKVG